MCATSLVRGVLSASTMSIYRRGNGSILGDKGVVFFLAIVAAQSWALPQWWQHHSFHNSGPAAQAAALRYMLFSRFRDLPVGKAHLLLAQQKVPGQRQAWSMPGRRPGVLDGESNQVRVDPSPTPNHIT